MAIFAVHPVVPLKGIAAVRCRSWASEGCEHFDAETGEPIPAFTKQFEEAARLEAESDAAMENL